ncbi:MAG TPA: phenylalanine--tRNA ligase subunit alpha, partial [Spirochaetaceae bacterium]|nr:phenylalanine--tRNA ligase subunit alpha [Spirochaetaceae bacterium]
MEPRSLLKGLHPLEIKVLLHYAPGDELDSARLVRELGYVEGQANQAQAWLSAKGLAAETGRSSRLAYELTDLGRSWAASGSPEDRLLAFLRANGPAAMPAICAAIGLEQKDAGSAFGRLSKEGLLSMTPEKLVAAKPTGSSARSEALSAILDKAIAADGLLDEGSLSAGENALMAEVAKKRGAADAPFRAADRETVRWALSPEAGQVAALLREEGVSGDEVGALTQDMLESGAWKTLSFRSYNLQSR